MNPDWEAVRRAYGQGETIGALSRRWSIPESTLRGRARERAGRKLSEIMKMLKNAVFKKVNQIWSGCGG